MGPYPNLVLTVGAVCGKNLVDSESISSVKVRMDDAGPHHAVAGQHQVDANPHQTESRGFQYGNPLVNLEQRGDREGSVRTMHTSKS